MVTVRWSTRTSCRQLFKELNILTLASLYILEVISFIRKYHQSVQLNSNIHTYNRRRKMDIRIQSHNTKTYKKKSVINMGTKVYNKLPNYIKQIVIRPLRKSWNNFFFCIPFIQWKNLYFCNYLTFNILTILHFKFILQIHTSLNSFCRILLKLLLES